MNLHWLLLHDGIGCCPSFKKIITNTLKAKAEFVNAIELRPWIFNAFRLFLFCFFLQTYLCQPNSFLQSTLLVSFSISLYHISVQPSQCTQKSNIFKLVTMQLLLRSPGHGLKGVQQWIHRSRNTLGGLFWFLQFPLMVLSFFFDQWEEVSLLESKGLAHYYVLRRSLLDNKGLAHYYVLSGLLSSIRISIIHNFQ